MKNLKFKLLYVDALCGAGKTYSGVRYVHSLATRGQKVLVVQPSRYLIDSTEREELSRLAPIKSTVIHGERTKSVLADIVRHIRNADDGGEILFITQAAFFALPYFHRKDRWVVFLDEVPQVDQFSQINIPDNQELLLPHFSVVEHDAKYGLAAPSDDAGRRALDEIARNKSHDDVWGLFQGFAQRTISDDWSVYVQLSQYGNLTSGHDDQCALTSYSLLEPSIFAGFKRVIIAGACFKDTLLYRLWSAQGVEFEALKLPLRYTKHSNGNLLRIRYLTEEPWSKALRDRAHGEANVLEAFIGAIKAEFADEQFLWMGNTDLADDIFGPDKGIRLPNSPHGLNTYQATHNVAVLSALNPPPAHFSFLGTRGVDGEEVRNAHYRNAVYQAAMRSSLRNPDDQSAKTVVVADRDTADYLANLFPGADVAAMGGQSLASLRGKPGRKRQHLSDADRKNAHRERLTLELLVEQGVILGDDIIAEDYPELAANVLGGMTELGGLGDPAMLRSAPFSTTAGTVFGSIYDSEPLSHVRYGDDQTFIDGLRSFHDRKIACKEDAGLLSPAYFDPSMAETGRGLANVRVLRGIFLDNDGGHLSHAEFARLLPRLRIVVWNTYSSTPEKPRWRAFIPTTHATSKRIHDLILEQIFRALNDGGYWSEEQLRKNSRIKNPRTHGFDLSKLNAASLFYLPAQAKHPEGSFFVDYGENDARRGPISPSKWVKRSIVHQKVEPEPAKARTESKAQVAPKCPDEGLERLRAALTKAGKPKAAEHRRDVAIQEWQEVARQPGVGHSEFFRLGAALKRAGLDPAEVEQTLSEQAWFARHPSERRSQIADIVRSLAKGGWL